MAPKQAVKDFVQRGKRAVKSSPRRSNRHNADGRAWISIAKGIQSGDIGKVDVNATDCKKAIPSTSTANVKKRKLNALPSRTSPRRNINVKLFGPSIGVKQLTKQQQPQDDEDRNQSAQDNQNANPTTEANIKKPKLIAQPTRTSPRRKINVKLFGPSTGVKQLTMQQQPQVDEDCNNDAQEDQNANPRTKGDAGEEGVGVHASQHAAATDAAEASTRPTTLPNAGASQEAMPQNATESSDMNNATYTVAPSTRGKTRGISNNKNKQPNEKMTVTVPTHLMRFIGKYSKEVTTEIGVIVRSHAPLNVDGWAQIDEDTKAYMIERLEDWFDFGNEPHVRVALLAQMRRSYRAWRYRLYDQIRQLEDIDDVFELCPDNVCEEEWLCFVWVYMTEEFQNVRNKNRRSREAPRTNHCGGTKSFARHLHESKTEATTGNGSAIDRFSLYHQTHFNVKKNKWVDDNSRDIYEQLISLRENYDELSQDEIFDIVLPQKSIYIPAMGIGPKRLKNKTRQDVATLEREVEKSKKREEEARLREDEARVREDDLRNKADDALAQNKEMAARIAELEQQVRDFADLRMRFDAFEKLMSVAPRWSNGNSQCPPGPSNT